MQYYLLMFMPIYSFLSSIENWYWMTCTIMSQNINFVNRRKKYQRLLKWRIMFYNIISIHRHHSSGIQMNMNIFFKMKDLETNSIYNKSFTRYTLIRCCLWHRKLRLVLKMISLVEDNNNAMKIYYHNVFEAVDILICLNFTIFSTWQDAWLLMK